MAPLGLRRIAGWCSGLTMLPLSFYATQAMHGLVYGMLLFLVASGLTLVFGMMRVLNVAHAGFYMLGAYLAYAVTKISGDFWLSLVIVPILTGLLGGTVERVLLRPIQALGHAYEMLLTFGLFYMIGEAVIWTWGTLSLQVPTPALLEGSIPLFGALYPIYRLFILAFSTIVCIAMAVVLMRTRIGIIIRSTVSDDAMVASLGIPTHWVRFGVFAAGSALAGLAGAIAAPFQQADPLMGSLILVDAFVVVVLGGFGSLMGALLAALIIGQIQSFGILLLPEFAMVFQFMLMAGVLIFRPQGLFGEAG